MALGRSVLGHLYISKTGQDWEFRRDYALKTTFKLIIPWDNNNCNNNNNNNNNTKTIFLIYYIFVIILDCECLQCYRSKTSKNTDNTIDPRIILITMTPLYGINVGWIDRSRAEGSHVA